MAVRNQWRSNDYLVKDEESGYVRYASDMRLDYYGKTTHYRSADGPHPQEFVKPLRDPAPLPFILPLLAQTQHKQHW